MYTDGQKVCDLPTYYMKVFKYGFSSVEAKILMFYDSKILEVHLEKLSIERKMYYLSVADWQPDFRISVEKVALGSLGLVYLGLHSPMDNSTESNNIILRERVLVITSASEMVSEEEGCRVSLREIMERYAASGQLEEKDLNGKEMRIEHLMMFGRRVLVYYSLIQKKTNNDNSEDGDQNGEADNRVEDDTNKGLFVLDRKNNMKVLYRVLHKSKLNGSNISCRWAFVKNTPVVMFWCHRLHFEFFVLHSNGRLCTMSAPMPFSMLHTIHQKILPYFNIAMDPFNARIYLHNEVDNQYETHPGSIIIFSFDMVIQPMLNSSPTTKATAPLVWS
jgi:hypothetical protein